ncbi:MAG: 6-carboxytetrahydropterin synthase [Candidatus Poribacteria bacterium]|nr:6-carboxytetrahydropterin synthase [Candidatus Poribacteria bacterium]
MPTVRLSRKVEFEASHFYRLPHLSDEENRARFGPTATAHGHNWTLHVAVVGELDPSNGMVVNIKDIDDLLKRKIVAQLDHKCLPLDHPYFAEWLPTTENIALFIWNELADDLPPECRLDRVKIIEGADFWSETRGEETENDMPTVYLSKAYEFSASHRLHEPSLSDAENLDLFGKCNNPNGHGHNYRVEVTVAGELDRRSGMITDLGSLDALVGKEVLERFDYKFINQDVPEFRDLNPTSENVVQFIYETLAPHFAKSPERLHRVRLYETHKSWFDYGDTD